MRKIIFKKIKGRIVPIKSRITKDIDFPDTSRTSYKKRKIQLQTDKNHVGTLSFSYSKKKNAHVDLDDIRINDKFRKHGLSSSAFDHLAKLTKKMGRKFIRSSEIVHPAQIKIRSKYKTKFLAVDEYGSGSRIVKADEALRLLSENGKKGNRKHFTIKAVTKA